MSTWTSTLPEKKKKGTVKPQREVADDTTLVSPYCCLHVWLRVASLATRVNKSSHVCAHPHTPVNTSFWSFTASTLMFLSFALPRSQPHREALEAAHHDNARCVYINTFPEMTLSTRCFRAKMYLGANGLIQNKCFFKSSLIFSCGVNQLWHWFSPALRTCQGSCPAEIQTLPQLQRKAGRN